MNFIKEEKDFIKNHCKAKVDLAMLDPKHTSQWCPGCGNFGILMAIKKAIVKLGINPKDVLVVSGIGCSSKLPHYLKTYGIETLHGRALPVAMGAKLANKDLHVIVVGGDGDGYGIGMGHLMHTIRRNINLTYIVHNNEIYALTKGQTSPTTPKGSKTASTPFGAIEVPVNPLEIAISAGCGFVARSSGTDIEGLSDLIIKGISHNGFSIIDTAQICVSFHPQKDFKWFKERVFKIENVEGYNPEDKMWAYSEINKLKNSDKIGVGVYYHNDVNKSYTDELPEDKKLPLVKQTIDDIDIEKILDGYE